MAKAEKTGIKKIILNVHGKEISLSMDEARNLKTILTELFPDPVKEKEYVPYHPVPLPTYPKPWAWPYREWVSDKVYPYGTWCAESNSSGTLYLTSGETTEGH